MMPTATCQYCGWNGPADQCGPLKNAWERVQPGDPIDYPSYCTSLFRLRQRSAISCRLEKGCPGCLIGGGSGIS